MGKSGQSKCSYIFKERILEYSHREEEKKSDLPALGHRVSEFHSSLRKQCRNYVPSFYKVF